MKYKYVVTVGDHPYEEFKYFMKEDRAQKYMEKKSSEYVNTDVNMFKWDKSANDWEQASLSATLSWSS
jgi:hypothetical protein